MQIKLWNRPRERNEKDLNFLIDLATITMIAENTKLPNEEPQTFHEDWSHSDPDMGATTRML